MSSVVEVEGLRKSYRTMRGRKIVAVDGLDLVVPAGGVFGFLGPNGAGKTTTFRCLLGLVRPSGGRLRILGADPKRLSTVIARVGSLIEAPAFFPGFSGRRNLRLLARTLGFGMSDVDKVLNQVNLVDRADDLFKSYSLGMKQRLGIAGALMRDPELLILDEPANGLDPAGIKEIRDLLRAIGAQGRTVLVSSHLLSEVQQTCDQVAIVANGRLIKSGRVEDILQENRTKGVVVRLDSADSLDQGVSVLQSAGMAVTTLDNELHVDIAVDRASQVTKALADSGLYLSQLRPVAVDLETVFLELTKDEHQA